MPTRTLTACLTCLLVIKSAAVAQETDEINLSRYQIVEEGERIKLLSEVNRLEDDYRELVGTSPKNFVT